MKKLASLLLLLFLFIGCKKTTGITEIKVTNNNELQNACIEAKPGDVIVMSDGIWNDIEIRVVNKGMINNPITLKAETSGKVLIQGKSDLKLGGEYIIVDGLFFTNGYSPSSAVIEFATDKETVANNCTVTNCVIKDYNKPQRNNTDLWVVFKGRNNQMDHCYLSGKSNRGPTLRVDLEGNQNINNYHRIIDNHFGPRPPKGGPSAETIQIGNSYTSMSPSYTMVKNNFFERCNGEVEIISSKTNFNEFRNNVFYKSEGSLVTRHGNYCTVDGNYFIGDETENIGGIRLIGTGHIATNNYFYNLRGKDFRSPLAVMNGIPKSPLNRYIQVTDVVIAYNTWINCTSPLQFGVGSNVSQKDVLPASEIRSARPIRTIVANNLLYNKVGDESPIVAHDLLDGINFQSNVINNQGIDFEKPQGIVSKSFDVTEIGPDLWTVKGDLLGTEVYAGFEFDKISKDLFGNNRIDNNRIGAIVEAETNAPDFLDKTKYGPSWYELEKVKSKAKEHSAGNSATFESALKNASEGDIINLSAGNYSIPSSLTIDKSITIQASDPSNKPVLSYTGQDDSPLFEMNPKGQLTLKNISLFGNKSVHAFASLKENMSSLYNLTLENCQVENFDYILKAYKYSFAEHLIFKSSTFKNCINGLELSEEIEDKGEYNAENITISGCQFINIDQNVVDYYRGGYDESTVGGNLSVTNNTFIRCGAREKNGVLINTYGIINVDISGNTFQDNRVKLVALLWGAKNNTHAKNKINNSGKILVEENLKLNLLY